MTSPGLGIASINDIEMDHNTLRKAKVRTCSLHWMKGEIPKETNKRYI